MKKTPVHAAVLAIACTLLGSIAVAQPRDLSAELALDPKDALPVREEVYELGSATLPFPTGETPPGAGIRNELTALVVAPDVARSGYPFALFIHGQAAVCVDASGQPTSDGECANGKKVPSYRGFAGYQRALAARGWITVSVSLNGILSSIVAMDEGTGTQLMAALAEEHLKRWSAWASGQQTSAAPESVRRGVLPDLSQLMLIGHSRGGAAANQVALRSVTESLPWRARAQVLIAPTMTHHNPAPSVPVVVLLPECDGDVTNLQGQGYVDRSRDLGRDAALRSAVLISGANHKFFNSEWDAASATLPEVGVDDAATLASDAPGNTCRPGAAQRLRGEQQRALGELYIVAAASGLVQGNERVLPLLDGSLACAGASCSARVSTHALGGGKQPLLIPRADSAPGITPCFTARDGGQEGACITSDMPKLKEVTRTPHFGSIVPLETLPRPAQEPSAVALRLDWTGTEVPIKLPLTNTRLAPDASELALRVIAAPGVDAASFEVALLDAQDRALVLGVATLRAPADADPATGVYWAQETRLAIPRGGADFDLAAPVALRLIPRTSGGHAWLLDAWSYVPGAAKSLAGSVARFAVAGSARPAANAGAVLVPVQVFGQLAEPAEVYYYIPGSEGGHPEGRFSIPAGQSKIELELPAATQLVYLLGVKSAVATRLAEPIVLPQAER